jgi:hypothetical protein
MKQTQEFLTVWKDGSEWFDFPKANEQGVMDMLVQKNEMQNCVFLPKGEVPVPIRIVTIQAPKPSESEKDKEIAELKRQLAQQQKAVKPTTNTNKK